MKVRDLKASLAENAVQLTLDLILAELVIDFSPRGPYLGDRRTRVGGSCDGGSSSSSSSSGSSGGGGDGGARGSSGSGVDDGCAGI